MFKKLLKMNAQLVSKKPKLVLLGALIMTIVAGVLASNLSMELNWIALAPEGSPAVKEYQEIVEDFPTLDSIIVLVESDDRDMLAKVAEETKIKVSELDEYVTSVVSGVDKDFMLKNAALYMDEEEVQMMGYVFSDPNVDKMYEFMYLMMDETVTAINEGEVSDEEIQYSVATFDAMSSLLLQTQDAVEGDADDGAIKDALTTFFTGSSMVTSPDGKMTMLTIQPSFDMMDMQKIMPGVDAIEEVIDEMDAKYENVRVRATGMHFVARDEAASIESDSYLTTLISLAFILTVLYLAFRTWVAPAFAFVPLAFGIIWAMGIMGVVLGRLNMMTVFSVVMLLGLGIDYAIHMYSSYTERRSEGVEKAVSIEYAIIHTGPSIIVGALTTALAFFALNISKLRILSELGTVMGMGIITTLVSVFWVLPALIILKKEKEAKMKKIKGNYPAIGWLAKGVYRAKYVVLAIIVAGAIFMGFKAKDIKFDMNLMNMEPEGLESIELMEYMVEKYDMSSNSFTVQVSSLEEVYRLHDEFDKLDNVSEVMSVASIIPKDKVQEEKLETVADVKDILEYKADVRTVDKETLKIMVGELKTKLETYEDAWMEKDLGILKKSDFEDLRATLVALENTLSKDVDEEKLEELSTIVYESMGEIQKGIFSGEKMTVADLPDAYKAQFVSRDESKFLITIYPDFDIWEALGTEKGDAFLQGLSAVEQSVTGTPIFMKDLFDAVGEELYLTMSVLIVILLIILLIHFKSFKYALLAFLPLAFTLVYMVGTMTLLSIDFNMLNFLAVLLIIGIGLDDGIHVLHHYKEGERNIKKLYATIGRAILLTTITTVCGFGSLSFSSYRGIAGLGVVLAIGVSMALIFTIVVLPIFLKDESDVKEKEALNEM